MKYFFVPGRLESLSWKELTSVCHAFFRQEQYILENHTSFFLLDIDLDIGFLFPRLGGFTKYGLLLNDHVNIHELVSKDKFNFGISSYSGSYSVNDVTELSKNLKKEFSKLGKKVRFVLPQKEKYLSTTQILKNRLLNEGLDLNLFDKYYGQTLGVQDIDGFRIRDYEKPYVDVNMGVMPVKLARMMLNYTEVKPSGLIWDPFCGSGNILLEALDLGYDVVGSDIDESALVGSKENINWAKEKFGYKQNASISFFDVLNPTQSKINFLKSFKFDAIVCEPYMGKAQKRPLDLDKAQSLIKQHHSLVSSLFSTLKHLKTSTRMKIVIVFPEYKTKKGWVSIDTSKLSYEDVKLLECKDLHWSRRNSIIRRLIFIFEYNCK